MRLLTSVGLSILLPASLVAQSLNPRAAALRHATVVSSASASSVARGATVTLWADVTPKPGIHIYAEGAKEFSPVALTLVKLPDVTAAAPKYPSPTAPVSLKATAIDAPAYYTTFRIAQTITIATTAKAGEMIAVQGSVNYQACDDRLCYPVTSEPVSWTVTVK